MWSYQKKLEYPINIRKPDARAAKIIMTQYGGPDGELGASLRYLSQRFAMPYKEVVGTLTDVGTEELAHLEMICTMIYQLTRNLSIEEIKAQGFADYFVDHTTGIWPSAATGVPFSSNAFQSKGDILTDLHEDMAADAALWNVQTFLIECKHLRYGHATSEVSFCLIIYFQR